MGDDAAIDGLGLRGEPAEPRQNHGQPQMQAIEPLTGTDRHLRPCLRPRLGQSLPQTVAVELLPVIHPQADRVPVEKNQPLPVLSSALHRHKTTQLVGPARQVTALPLEHDRPGQPTHAEGDDEPPALSELVGPRRGA